MREARPRPCSASVLLLAAAAFLISLSQPVLSAERLTLNFNPDWKFLKADPAGAADPAFADASWTPVSAPHTWNDTDTFDDWSPPSHVGETNQWSGRAWYRKSFTLPDALKSKKVFLEF
ncbi:MAG TPA: glycoside hydrolase family 2, partial [Methylomirabilota bacterium]|nr:glycoside hydrolase family 2 [Methylomirabilota bacterium]